MPIPIKRTLISDVFGKANHFDFCRIQESYHITLHCSCHFRIFATALLFFCNISGPFSTPHHPGTISITTMDRNPLEKLIWGGAQNNVTGSQQHNADAHFSLK
jgi:hypothetical protein